MVHCYAHAKVDISAFVTIAAVLHGFRKSWEEDVEEQGEEEDGMLEMW